MIKLVIAFIQPPKSKFRGLDFTPIHTPLISNSTLLLQQKQFFIFFSVNSSNGINKVRNIQCSSLKDSLIAPRMGFQGHFLDPHLLLCQFVFACWEERIRVFKSFNFWLEMVISKFLISSFFQEIRDCVFFFLCQQHGWSLKILSVGTI